MRKITLKKNIHIKVDCITIRIPKGFKTDGASIPRIFWWFGKPFDKDTLIPAMVHDKMYRTSIPKLISDLVFLELMKRNGVSFIKRWLYFKFVILFGRRRPTSH